MIMHDNLRAYCDTEKNRYVLISSPFKIGDKQIIIDLNLHDTIMSDFVFKIVLIDFVA